MRAQVLYSTLVVIFCLASCPSNAEYFGIPPDEFRQHYRPQQETQWCWAASVEMVLATQEVNVPHNAIVEYIKGVQLNMPGSVEEMAKAINGMHKDATGRPVIVAGQPVNGAPFPAVLFNHMKNRNPTILTYQGGPGIGHAVVLFGIEADVDTEQGTFFITGLHVADPFPVMRVSTPYGVDTVFDENRYWHRTYRPQVMQYGPYLGQQGIGIEVGMITSVTLVTGTVIGE